MVNFHQTERYVPLLVKLVRTSSTVGPSYEKTGKYKVLGNEGVQIEPLNNFLLLLTNQ
jgi:hypothetical protein